MRVAVRPAILVVALAGCAARCDGASSSSPPPQVRAVARAPVVVGYGAPESSAGQAVAIQRPFVERARARGWEVLRANAEGDAKVQAGHVDYFLSRKVDAVVVVPVSSKEICASVERARRSGVPFFTIDRAPIGCEVDLSVLSDNRMAGVQAGEAMVDLLTRRHGKPQGVVLEVQGDLRQNVAQLRSAGFHSIVDAYPGIRVLSRETQWDPARVAEVTRRELADPSVEGVFLHSDSLAIPVLLPILKQTGRLHPRDSPRHVFITGVDGSREALDAIRQGWADQSSSQPMPDFALAVEYVEQRLRGEPFVEGTVTRTGAPWSPARLHRSPSGWQLELATTSVTPSNVDSPGLWANQP
jgi:ABC-type sugar transport system substrate-binding protein